MDTVLKKAIIRIIIIGISNGIIWACPTVMDLESDLGDTVIVGQTVTFTASCDVTPQGYNWVLPSSAYNVSGIETAQVSCKFDTIGNYSIQVYFLYAGNSYGPESLSISVLAAKPIWYVSPEGKDGNDGQSWESAFRTIQTAIDLASPGHKIIVSEGTYRESISLKGKDLTIRSSDPENWSVVQNTIINGHGQGSVVFFNGSETTDCLFKGFTVMGGGILYEDPLNNYLEGHWELDENTGTEVPDSSGKEHNGDFKPDGYGPIWDSAGGRTAGCLSFDGEDYVEMGNYYGVVGTAARTTCAWIKLPSSGSSRTILSYGGTTYRSEWLFMVNEDNKLQLGVYGGNIIGSPVLATNRWYHVAAVLDDWNGDGLKVNDLRLYIDGKQVTGSYYNPNEALSTGNSYPVRIGSHVSTNYKFIGQIDDVRLYNKALTESEIRSLAGDVGKVAHWKLDNGSGNTATDSSGNEFDGTLIGNPGWEVGKLGSCLLFDGDDHVVVSGFTGISGEQPRTVCAWIQTNQASEGMILAYGTTGTGKQWMLFVNNNHKLQLGVNGGNTYSAQVIADGQWHHVAALLDPPVSGPAKVQNLRLFIDGQIAERFYTNPNQEINTKIAANYPVRIGANQISPEGGLGTYFNGKIDDVRLYSRALSEAEIRAIYSQGGGFCGNGTQAAISNCVIRDNDNLLDGGGIQSVDGDITNCFIIHNTSAANGGGLADCDGLITNCVIADNEAAGGGALSNCNGEIVNCSIVNNRTHISGILDRCTGSIANCILWNNTGTLLTYSAPTYSCFPCGSGNNLNANPQFRSLSDLKGADEIFGTEDDGLILQGGSPCLDTGNNSFVPFGISEDITGRNRKLDGDHDQSSVVDMGAYETPRIWYVDCNVASSGDGKTWATAKKTIQEGIHASQDGDVVLVADGTYTGGVYNGVYKDPNRNRDLDFEGRAITLQSQNGPGACIIDCEGGDSDPHRGFYFHSNEGPDSVVHGFTIQNGYVNNSLDHYPRCYGDGSGGAIACGNYVSPSESASPTITNCIFRNNYAHTYGGGVFCICSDANIINSIFVANKAGSNGGGMYSKFQGNNKILNCTFIMNYAEYEGGGLYVFESEYLHADVTNSIFWGNKNRSTFDQIKCNILYTVVSYSCIQGGWDSNSIGNIAEYPNFIDADADDFHLQAGSPCIDAGTNLTVPLLFYVDLDGNPRRIDDPSTQDTGYGQPPIADMGAYEYRPPTSPDTNNPLQVNAGIDKIVKVQNWLDLSDAIASGQKPLTYLWTSSPDSVQFDPPSPQDSNTSADLHPQVRFYEVGEYSLQLLADDGQDTAADTLAVTVVSVHAGPSQIIYLPSNQVRLNATIQGPALASVQWSVVPEFSPSAEVAFSAYSISDYDSNATFTEPGRYMLRITAEFAGFEGIFFSDETIVTVKIDDNPANPANNTAPTVSAWAEPTAITWPVNTTYLVGRVSDDGHPDGRLSVRWSPVSWPIDGGVTFGTYSVADPSTTATFSRPGAYELLLTADDGDKQTSQPVLVTVLPPDTQPDNDPPTASAGGDRTIHRSPFSPFAFTPNSYADDPTPTGYLSIQWTVIEGPQGGLALSDPTAAQTQITFFQTGTWTLLLTVSDGQYTVID